MSDKFWNFSKAERVAAIALTIIIVSVLAISFLVNTKSSVETKDYSSEIEEFKSRIVSTDDTVKVVKKKTRKRPQKTYTPNTQKLSPLQKEGR
ncbi:MAG: hypothetical protein IKW05_02625 [Muribaculaceae bacterium]|nr:hypothetical protein [Muribaculaceae bacterium]MBR5323685.1 hypothetical protein [Muribaculaceae bacterium]